MTPRELAEKYFPEFKMVGAEIKARYCPFCNGGRSHDQYTFGMNAESGAYNCKRGSCDEKGSFRQLLKHLGEETENFELQKPKEKSFTPPKVETKALGEKAIGYLEKRGFSRATWEYWNLKEYRGAIVFPYYQDGNLVLVKYRKPEKYTGQGQKAWREKGGKAVFWGMDKCDPSKMLIITEGEFDTMALTEAGVENVVSVPSGAEDLTCVENCWEWLQRFSAIYIWPDNDQPGQEMCRKLVSKLGAHRCYVVQCEHKDANVALVKEGKEKIWEYLETAKEVPISGLLRLAEVKAFELKDIGRVRSSINGINKIVGGYMEGMLSVWTGINSSGKSTLLGQELVDAIDQGYRVCAYSGEMPAPIFRYWIDLQIAGPHNLSAEYDEYRQEDVMRVKRECVEPIRNWYYNSFFIYDSMGGVSDENLFKVFEYSYMRYGCKVFLVDNLMLMVIGDSDKDFYRKQSDFVKKLKHFAEQYSVHVHLVAHPRKTGGRLEKMDVMGSGDITNIADNVFSVHRVPEDEREKEECDAFIDIFKNRFSGRQDIPIAVMFDDRCKRFYMESDRRALVKDYGWQGVE